MTYDHNAGRADLHDFAARQPDNYWDADEHLRRVVKHWASESDFAAWETDFSRFGGEAATIIDEAARLNDRRNNHPVLERWGPYGERLEAVEHHPSYHVAGRYIYGSGIIAALGEAGGNLKSQTLGFISGLNGEAGHNCPMVCTSGLVKALIQVGNEELKGRYLPRLLSTNYDELAHGAQFLTEVQGGSDVGENSIVARPVEGKDGEWTIHGEKWFCSNVTADLILMTARPEGAPEGTKGLGLFLVPRRLPDGRLNDFQIRRLKDKLGTRTMASAELDFNGATGWNLGPIEDGFKNMMTWVITTSRLCNAVGTSANARRATMVAQGYAERRKAFGARIIEYPMVQETLSDMLAESAAMTSGSFSLLHHFDRIERGEADEGESGYFRMAVNLNKMRSAQSAHEVILSGIEMLAGNGAIESFSVLPRLLRDNVVYENWEGAHNVLLVQVLRDCHRLNLHEPFLAHLAEMVKDHPRLTQAVKTSGDQLASLLAGDPAEASLRIRDVGRDLAFVQWAASMLVDGTPEALREHFIDRRLGPTAAKDSTYLKRIASLTGMA